jgi:hypothetical protein
MAFWFPGWPGSVFDGRRGNIPNVGLPAFPTMPGSPQTPAGAGLPGGAGATQAGGAAAASPLAGLAQYGVPVGMSPGGRPVIRANMNGGVMLPPEIPGMPKMPGPPGGFLGTGQTSGGLFQPIDPVIPFDSGNQVRHYQDQDRRQ